MGRDSVVVHDTNRPHVVVVPYPAQGHINPLLKFAKILHGRGGFHVTFVNTEYNARRLLRSRGPASLNDWPGFRFEAIPDGLPPVDADVMQDVPALSESLARTCLETFVELVSRVNRQGGPPVSCFVFDAMMPFVAEAAEKFGLPAVAFWPPAACAIWGVAQYPKLIEKGLVPLKDSSYLTNGFLDTVIEWIPGINNFRLRDIPTFVQTTDPNDIMVHYLIRSTHAASKKACAMVINTFDALEPDTLHALSSIYPDIYTVGPLNLVLDRFPGEKLTAVGSNLWKEDDACLKWLDSREHGSVVYINFGSITVATAEQMTEFAWGLANSRKPFLWVIRPDLVLGESAVLPPGFKEETADRCMISGWCPQEEVLKHPSVGGFLTHSGWNSTLESISAGVPMTCWPFFADQQTNCWYAKNVWGIGMEIDRDVKRDEVEAQVRELMEGEKGKEMKRRAAGWRSAVEKAVAPGGSSSKNLEKIISLLITTRVSSIHSFPAP